MTKKRYPQRLQVSIATLLWLTVCVASFFGGQYWNHIDRTRTALVRYFAHLRPTTSTQLRLRSGQTCVVNANVAIHRLLTADPTIATIVPDTSTTFIVTAKRGGKTDITIWGETANEVTTYSVSVQ